MVLLTGFALFMLTRSAFPLPITIIWSSALSMICWKWAIKRPFPHPDCITLGYEQGKWTLTLADQSIQRYDTHRILVNAGIGFLLNLQAENQKRLLVIFTDQISQQDYQFIKMREML